MRRDGPSAGAPLTTHGDVDKIAFTGSVVTGQRIMKACADGTSAVGN